MSKQFVLCINQGEYLSSLEVRKLYQVKPDANASAHGLIRIIDESGEDYLYPASLFEAVALPDALVRRLTASERQAQSQHPTG